jgi:hypothetical protein
MADGSGKKQEISLGDDFDAGEGVASTLTEIDGMSRSLPALIVQ